MTGPRGPRIRGGRRPAPGDPGSEERGARPHGAPGGNPGR